MISLSDPLTKKTMESQDKVPAEVKIEIDMAEDLSMGHRPLNLVAGTTGEWAGSAWGGLGRVAHSDGVNTAVDADKPVQTLTPPRAHETMQPVLLRHSKTLKDIKVEPATFTDADTLNNLQCEQVKDPSHNIQHEIVRDSYTLNGIKNKPVHGAESSKSKKSEPVRCGCVGRSGKYGLIRYNCSCEHVRSETVTDTDSSRDSSCPEAVANTDTWRNIQSQATADTDTFTHIKKEADVDTDSQANIESESASGTYLWTDVTSESVRNYYIWKSINREPVTESSTSTNIQPVDETAVSSDDTAVKVEPLPPGDCHERLPSDSWDCVSFLQRKAEGGAGVFEVPSVSTGGRPRYLISREQLLALLNHGYSAAGCARLLHVSRSTVTRLMRVHGLSVRSLYCQDISDEDLDRHIRDITAMYPNGIGYRACRVKLQGRGILLPYERVRQSMLRVDPVGAALRWGNKTQRRS